MRGGGFEAGWAWRRDQGTKERLSLVFHSRFPP
jgi:hypothetical protein